MSRFVLTAEIQMRGPTSSELNLVASRIRSALTGINVPINIVISPAQQRALNTVNQSLRNVKASAIATSDSFEQLGKSLSQNIRRYGAFTAATGAFIRLGIAIRQSVGEAIDFETEIRKIAQGQDRAISSYAGLKTEIDNLSKSLGVSSLSLASTSRILAQAGLSAYEVKAALSALAKSTLAPTFGEMNETTEASIAIMRQFKIEASGLESVLGSINQVAADFAVESEDIAAAVRLAGASFAAASPQFQEGEESFRQFISLFTSVRQTTRGSAESIATGLRTITTRLQRGGTIEYFHSLGIELTNSEGQFIGAYEAIRKVSAALENIPGTDSRFANIAELLGGYRQIDKTIPLLQQFAVAERAYQSALKGRDSLDKGLSLAQETLAVRFARVKEEFNSLVRKISENEGFRAMIGLSLKLASALIKVVDAVTPLLPLIAALGLVKFGIALPKIGRGFAADYRSAVGRKADGGKVHYFNKGGIVPGHGNSDTVPAMLTPGERIIPKKDVQKFDKGGQYKVGSYGASSLSSFGLPVDFLEIDKYTKEQRRQLLSDASPKNLGKFKKFQDAYDRMIDGEIGQTQQVKKPKKQSEQTILNKIAKDTVKRTVHINPGTIGALFFAGADSKNFPDVLTFNRGSTEAYNKRRVSEEKERQTKITAYNDKNPGRTIARADTEAFKSKKKNEYDQFLAFNRKNESDDISNIVAPIQKHYIHKKPISTSGILTGAKKVFSHAVHNFVPELIGQGGYSKLLDNNGLVNKLGEDIISQVNIRDVMGKVFEASISSITGFAKANSQNDNFDFHNVGLDKTKEISKFFSPQFPGGKLPPYTDAKFTSGENAKKSIRKKILNQLSGITKHSTAIISKDFERLTIKESINDANFGLGENSQLKYNAKGNIGLNLQNKVNTSPEDYVRPTKRPSANGGQVNHYAEGGGHYAVSSDNVGFTPKLVQSLLRKIKDGTKVNLLLGASGVGKSYYTEGLGAKPLRSESAVAKAGELTFESAANKFENIEDIVNLVKKTGGFATYLTKPENEIKQQRDSRAALSEKGKGNKFDKRSVAALRGTSFAPTQLHPDLIAKVKEVISQFNTVGHYANGGLVPGSGNTDSVPMNLENGQYVIRKKAVEHIGASNLAKFAQGGVANSLVMPGEYVFDAPSAKRIGTSTLGKLNHADKYASGGSVGLQRFVFGGKKDKNKESDFAIVGTTADGTEVRDVIKAKTAAHVKELLKSIGITMVSAVKTTFLGELGNFVNKNTGGYDFLRGSPLTRNEKEGIDNKKTNPRRSTYNSSFVGPRPSQYTDKELIADKRREKINEQKYISGKQNTKDVIKYQGAGADTAAKKFQRDNFEDDKNDAKFDLNFNPAAKADIIKKINKGKHDQSSGAIPFDKSTLAERKAYSEYNLQRFGSKDSAGNKIFSDSKLENTIKKTANKTDNSTVLLRQAAVAERNQRDAERKADFDAKRASSLRTDASGKIANPIERVRQQNLEKGKKDSIRGDIASGKVNAEFLKNSSPAKRKEYLEEARAIAAEKKTNYKNGSGSPGGAGGGPGGNRPDVNGQGGESPLAKAAVLGFALQTITTLATSVGLLGEHSNKAVDGVTHLGLLLGTAFSGLSQIKSILPQGGQDYLSGIQDKRKQQFLGTGARKTATGAAVLATAAAAAGGAYLSSAGNEELSQGKASGAIKSAQGSALTGAATGAALGVAFGPLGVAIGAAAGAAIGFTEGMMKASKAIENFNPERLSKSLNKINTGSYKTQDLANLKNTAFVQDTSYLALFGKGGGERAATKEELSEKGVTQDTIINAFSNATSLKELDTKEIRTIAKAFNVNVDTLKSDFAERVRNNEAIRASQDILDKNSIAAVKYSNALVKINNMLEGLEASQGLAAQNTEEVRSGTVKGRDFSSFANLAKKGIETPEIEALLKKSEKGPFSGVARGARFEIESARLSKDILTKQAEKAPLKRDGIAELSSKLRSGLEDKFGKDGDAGSKIDTEVARFRNILSKEFSGNEEEVKKGLNNAEDVQKLQDKVANADKASLDTLLRMDAALTNTSASIANLGKEALTVKLDTVAKLAANMEQFDATASNVAELRGENYDKVAATSGNRDIHLANIGYASNLRLGGGGNALQDVSRITQVRDEANTRLEALRVKKTDGSFDINDVSAEKEFNQQLLASTRALKVFGEGSEQVIAALESKANELKQKREAGGNAALGYLTSDRKGKQQARKDLDFALRLSQGQVTARDFSNNAGGVQAAKTLFGEKEASQMFAKIQGLEGLFKPNAAEDTLHKQIMLENSARLAANDALTNQNALLIAINKEMDVFHKSLKMLNGDNFREDKGPGNNVVQHSGKFEHKIDFNIVGINSNLVDRAAVQEMLKVSINRWWNAQQGGQGQVQMGDEHVQQ